MIFGWFDSQAAESFGIDLADFLSTRFGKSKLGRKTFDKKHEALDIVLLKVVDFKKNHSLNVYKKAKLCYALKSRLQSLGYEGQFIDDFIAFIAQKL